MAKSILIDVNRCTGCWTCSMTCKTAHNLQTDEFHMFIRTIGGGGIDQAGGRWPDVYMKWNPVYTQTCLTCTGDDSTCETPYCVYNCPSGALYYGDLDDPQSEAAQRLEKRRAEGFRMWQQPPWEKTRDNVFYVEKGI